MVYRYARGPEIAPGQTSAERSSYWELVLEKLLREAVARLNPKGPAEARGAVRKLIAGHLSPGEAEAIMEVEAA